MKHAISALAAIVLIVGLTLGSFFAMSTPTPPASAEEHLVTCQLVVNQNTKVICIAAGVQVLNTAVDLPTVTLPPITLPPATVTAPPVTVTLPPVTLPAPPQVTATETVRIPLPQATATKTVTNNVPGATETIRVPVPGNTVTKTVSPEPTPVPTVTETVTEQATGQPQPSRDTLDPTSKKDDFFRFDLDLGDDSVSAGEAGVGLLGALLILTLIFAGMAYGFRRGMAAESEEEVSFLSAMLDRSKTS